MADLWYPGGVYDPAPPGVWGSFTDNGEPKFLLHTTEGSLGVYSPDPNMGAGRRYYGNTGTWPNYTLAWHAQSNAWRIYNHIPANRSSLSLRNPAGGVQTNRDNVTQVEIATRAVDVRALPNEALDELAKLLAWEHLARGVPLTSTVRWVSYPASYGENASQRLSGAAWDAYAGVIGHQHCPENCVHPDTPILCSDLAWRRAGDLAVGQEIVAFDEETVRIGTANGGRRYRRAVVTRNEPGLKESYLVRTTAGTVMATYDHPWLARLPYVNRGSRIRWVETQNLDSELHRLYSIGTAWEPDESKSGGWSAGVLDADSRAFAGGRHGSWLAFGQADGPVLDRFVKEYEPRGYATTAIKRDCTQRRSISARPLARTTKTVEILGVEPVGVQPIASISTSSRTYIANGLLCHNSHGDPGDFAIQTLLDRATDIVRGDDVTEQDKIDIANRVLEALRGQVFSVQPPIRQGGPGQVIGATYNKVGDLQSAVSQVAAQISALGSRGAQAAADSAVSVPSARVPSSESDDVSDRLDFLYTQLSKIADAAQVTLDPPPWRETTPSRRWSVRRWSRPT